ncbi:hypothetical protein MPTK1_5g08170 [Marchantia polymorpha subsp. ruderalis]|uniref:J domain-containing protein n=2 Tax=Marchantia polymorpha TaxID=3197 RepID=A0A176VXB1_MARPO|nr:hypothetical protein AXG93_2931s1550 [Marchantia polymorpha subsp. ruderalis]PTQ33687.1 hypothetical protein MARPO_0086s0021 [Marchantia polymorpha]BBN10989.1 hypothetical protein Mp_5g08170 [Marchantia polymorpha subsp. ruderalis]|eukprot:PTQ33687.1 hypothetical protein MARPO_0086s0021 [Marchantia polymorpha]
MEAVLQQAQLCSVSASFRSAFRLANVNSRLCSRGFGAVRCAGKRGGTVSTKRPANATGGFGAKAPVKTSFDAGVLLKRSEQIYTKLIAEHASEGDVREFIICVRQKSEKNSKPVLDDWLPVAELALVSEFDASAVLPQALPILCREVAECAAKGAVALRAISRSCLEYAYEPAEAFYDHVMSGSQMQLSSVECPYGVLGLPKGAPASEVRTAYRSLAAQNHPDKHSGENATAAEQEFKRVTSAYDQIKRAGLAAGGVPTYESLGGTGRNGLSEPISITSKTMSAAIPEGVQVAVRQLDPEITSRFLTRIYARSGGATFV